ncbi:uncharacterized protein LOC111328003 [Stylophora pistillata]|uniref:uncharacterized protein LOC111328003 n=1 Tax=Stylophora pistillata TaxID=50429 RepID=UPI000C056BC9|nr:uncharacterized protein LOC111328003 [Stylophora pistillata]
MAAPLQVFIALNFITLVLGHGRLIDPASRNSAWRYGFGTPRQDTDNELNCGGFSVQWDANKGKCGVCGDAYHFKPGKALYTHPGRYATGTITKTYEEGQDITVMIDVTSNHQGHFTFRVGDIGSLPITQEKLKYVLRQPNGDTKWKINAREDKIFEIKLKLPGGLTCDHCVLQWWWRVGNSWGCDGPNDCGMGKGQQETFVNCADIRITKKDGSVPPPPPTRPPPPTEKPPGPTEPLPTNAPNPKGCKAIAAWTGNKAIDDWCVRNCAKGNCPAHMCKCPK